MTWYLRITPVTEPYDIGVDEDGRILKNFNIQVLKTRSATFEEEIFGLLQTLPSGWGNVFTSSKSIVPAGDGPFISLITGGGTVALRTHNSIIPAYPRPSMQIIVRAKRDAIACAAAQAAYDVLAAVSNRDVPPVTIT